MANDRKYWNQLIEGEQNFIREKVNHYVESMSFVSSWMEEELANNLQEMLAELFIQSKKKMDSYKKAANDAKNNVKNTPEYIKLQADLNEYVTKSNNAHKTIIELKGAIAEANRREVDSEEVTDMATILDEKFGTNYATLESGKCLRLMTSVIGQMVEFVDNDKVSFTNNGTRV